MCVYLLQHLLYFNSVYLAAVWQHKEVKEHKDRLLSKEVNSK